MHLLKYREKSLILPNQRIGMCGEYRLEVMGADGRKHWLTDWFSNNITNVGLDMCGTTDARFAACQVGTGSAAPANGDTTLNTFHAGTATHGTIGSISESGSDGPDYWAEAYYRYDFPTGDVEGNITEVGVGPSASSGQNLFSRELIRDESGDSTSISILVTEALRVHYRIRHYAPTVDVSGAVNLGYSPDHTTTRRAAKAGNSGFWAPSLPSGFGKKIGEPNNYGARLSSSDLVALTSSNGGSSASSASTSSYVPGSHSRSTVFTWGVNHANFDIRTLTVSATNNGGNTVCGMFQIGFDPVIEKSNTQELALEVNIGWGRRI